MPSAEASSISAFAYSLENVAARFRRMLSAAAPDEAAECLIAGDLEEDVISRKQLAKLRNESPSCSRIAQPSPKNWSGLKIFVARTRSLPNDAKAHSFQDAINAVLELAQDGRCSGKAVVFH
jgi:hypothetical protein